MPLRLFAMAEGRDIELVMREVRCNWVGWPLPVLAADNR
jgi:hypothetical protein